MNFQSSQEKNEMGSRLFAERTLKSFESSNQVPGFSHLGPLSAKQNRGGEGGRIPVKKVADGEGPVGEKEEGVEAHL